MVSPLLLALAIAATSGQAPEPTHLAVGAALLDEQGLGGKVLLRGGLAGLELGAGVAPQLRLRSGACAVQLAAPGRVTASALGFFGAVGDGVEHGLRLGVSEDGRAGLGGMAGYRGEVRLGGRLSLELGFGLRFEPEAAGSEGPGREEGCAPAVAPSGRALLQLLAPYAGATLLFRLF